MTTRGGVLRLGDWGALGGSSVPAKGLILLQNCRQESPPASHKRLLKVFSQGQPVHLLEWSTHWPRAWGHLANPVMSSLEDDLLPTGTMQEGYPPSRL